VCVYKGKGERVVLRGWGRREKREEVDDGNSLGGKQRSAFRLSGPPLGVGLLLFFPPPSASRSGEIREAEWKRERERWKQVKFPSHPTPYTLYMYMYSTIESAPYLLIETIFLLEILLAISVVNSCDPLSSRKFIFSE
jgi:hypothetical protein